ncbi:MAG: LacI family DNA-binding transcriptional regulator [Actinomycetota bacterium]|nr:LacI family DNA-binding transcriptional regulator [Actinomycetota bacterium]
MLAVFNITIKHKIILPMSRAKKVTLKHIAQKAEVSINTVSRALSDKHDISKKTKEKIRNIAQELGYIPDAVAGSLRRGSTKTIAVIIPDIMDPLMSIWVKDIETRLRQNGYNIFVVNTDENYQREERAIYLSLSKKVDGIILCPCQKEDKDILFLKNKKINFVLLGRHFPHIQTDYVISSDIKGAYLATKYLLDNNRTRILLLNAHLYISSAQERYQGYLNAFREKGLKIDKSLVYEIGNTTGNTIQAIKNIVAKNIKFDAIFAFSDLMAWEAISCLQNLGFRIPKDIDVFGYDNIQSRFFFPYFLNTVNYSKRGAAHTAVDILLNKINNTSSIECQQEIIDTNIFIRKN